MTLHHYHQAIPGWFDFEDLYIEAVRKAPTGRPSTFVEVGAFMGRSLSFLGVEIVNSEKPIRLISIDSMPSVPVSSFDPDPYMQQAVALFGGRRLVDVLGERMKPCVDAGLWYKHYCESSRDASVFFEGESLDFVFIDADHSYQAVLSDLFCWWPTVRRGGRMAGHDHTLQFPGVIDAVREFFVGGARVSRSSWYVDKP